MKKFCETLKFILFLDFHAAMLAASYGYECKKYINIQMYL